MRLGPDEAVLVGEELHLNCPDGIGNSKLPGSAQREATRGRGDDAQLADGDPPARDERRSVLRPALLEDGLRCRQPSRTRRRLGQRGRLRRVTDDDDRPHPAVLREPEELGGERPRPGRDPGDPRAEAEHPGRDQQAFRGPSLVEGVLEVRLIAGQRDGDPDRRGPERACRGQARLVDLPEDVPRPDDDEPPRLAVPAAPRPARDLGQGVDLVIARRLGSGTRGPGASGGAVGLAREVSSGRSCSVRLLRCLPAQR